jgi:hypothetical protein
MAQRKAESPADTRRDSALRSVQSLAFLVGISICLALALVFVAQALGHSQAPPVVRLPERINPNEAPVPSLMRLPQIGLVRARAIVAQRDQVRSRAGRSPAFRTADDLQQIKGIGPAIVEGIRPWLAFDSPSRDSHEPADR